MTNSKTWMLTELSRQTLSSYADRASASLDKLSKKKMNKRANSVVKTNTRLVTQEDTDLQEVSASKLGRYIKKSGDDEVARRANGIKVRDHIRSTYGLNVGTPMDRKLYSPTASREAGRKVAIKKLTGNAKVNASEETELQELSRKTLSNYIIAAKKPIYHRARFQDPDYSHKHGEAKLFSKRNRGINMAAKKLAKEETELQELSRKALGNYVKRATNELHRDSYHAGQRQQNANYDQKNNLEHRAKNHSLLVKTNKRHKGIVRAADKLAREDVDLTELSARVLSKYLPAAVDDREHKKLDAATLPYKSQRQQAKQKAQKRSVGIRRAFDRWIQQKEEAGLQEISKYKLGNYISRAIDVKASNQNGLNYANQRLSDKPLHPDDESRYEKRRKIHSMNINKRNKGISLATKKIQKEETKLQEISRQKLVDYTRSAAREMADHRGQGMLRLSPKKRNQHFEKSQKRFKGILAATRRLAKD